MGARSRIALLVLFTVPHVAASHSDNARLHLFANLCIGAQRALNGTTPLQPSLTGVATNPKRCREINSICIEGKNNSQCRRAAQMVRPKLNALVGDIITAMVPLPAHYFSGRVPKRVTSAVVSIASNVDHLADLFGKVQSCSEMQSVVRLLCTELHSLTTHVVALVIPLIVLAVLGVLSGFLLFCCICFICCKCGVFRLVCGRGRRRVSFNPRVCCQLSNGQSSTGPLGRPVRTRSPTLKNARTKYATALY